MQVNTNPNPSPSLDQAQECDSEIRIELDHLLLAIEAIDLQATDVILELIKELSLTSLIPNRVSLWRLRNTNPYRRNYQRGTLTMAESSALIQIICHIARRINTLLRLLVTTSYQVSVGKIEVLGLQQNQLYLETYLQQFHDLFISRMAPSTALEGLDVKNLASQLLVKLLFCSGAMGETRLRNALTSHYR